MSSTGPQRNLNEFRALTCYHRPDLAHDLDPSSTTQAHTERGDSIVESGGKALCRWIR
jgi:hypothetical protein